MNKQINNYQDKYDREKYYLAYGSNLNLDHMKRLCPNAIVMGQAILKDFKLEFRGHEQGFLTIKESIGNDVFVGVYKITEVDERKLDVYEGYPKFYKKCIKTITLDNHEIKAIVYIMNDGYPKCLPAISYLDKVLDGYLSFNFDINMIDNAVIESFQDNVYKIRIKNKELSIDTYVKNDNIDLTFNSYEDAKKYIAKTIELKNEIWIYFDHFIEEVENE